jgi:hypothetical protein
MGGTDALNAVAARRATREDLLEVTNSLRVEFDRAGHNCDPKRRPRLRTVAGSGAPSELAVAAETKARVWLSQLPPALSLMS